MSAELVCVGGVWGGSSRSADPRSDGSGLHECEPQECVGTSNCGRVKDRPDVTVQVRVMLFVVMWWFKCHVLLYSFPCKRKCMSKQVKCP